MLQHNDSLGIHCYAIKLQDCENILKDYAVDDPSCSTAIVCGQAEQKGTEATKSGCLP